MDPLPADQRIRQRDYLLAIARAMTEARDLRTVLALVLRGAVTMTHGQAGAVALENASGQLEVVASYQLEERFTHFVDGTPVAGMALTVMPVAEVRSVQGHERDPVQGDAALLRARDGLVASRNESDAFDGTGGTGETREEDDSGAARGSGETIQPSDLGEIDEVDEVDESDGSDESEPAAESEDPDAEDYKLPVIASQRDDRQLLAFSLDLGGHTIGQLWVARSAEAAAFSATDEEVLRGFAAHAAAAIFNARGRDTASSAAGLRALALASRSGADSAPQAEALPAPLPDSTGTTALARRMRTSSLDGRVVLVAVGNPTLGRGIAERLERVHARVVTAATAAETLERVRLDLPDVVVLDADLDVAEQAKADGSSAFERLEALRSLTGVPIIVLTQASDPDLRVRLLDAGADDVLTQPVNPAELVGQAQALLRRSSPAGANTVLKVDEDLTIDFGGHTAQVRDATVKFTPTEWRLLHHFVQNAGWLLTHDMILAKVWGPEYLGQDNYVRLYVTYLRQKIERDPAQPRYILTERGVGYRFRALD